MFVSEHNRSFYLNMSCYLVAVSPMKGLFPCRQSGVLKLLMWSTYCQSGGEAAQALEKKGEQLATTFCDHGRATPRRPFDSLGQGGGRVS
jgi:hypothetical protein